MKNRIGGKGLILGIIVLLVGAGIIPSTLGTTEQNTLNSRPSSRGYIQGLIDNASAGDTIYISSGIYYENIIINKSISLIGEDKNTTIIDGGGSGDVVYVSADWVTISGFTIQNSGYWWYDAGINIVSSYCCITDNSISNNSQDGNGIYLWDGIYLWGSNSNTIISNTLSNNGHGISLDSSRSNIISGNNISNNELGIDFSFTNNNTIIGNTITNNFWEGIRLSSSSNNTIVGNTISKNDYGIFLEHSFFNFIFENNIINNIARDAFFSNSFLNCWKQNYWGRTRILPKLIFGELCWTTGHWHAIKHYAPWFNIDWHPALKPYEIGG